MRILLAEANEEFRELLLKELRCRLPDADVDTAEDGRTLLEKASKHRPDLVVANTFLPQMDGICALRELRKSNVQPPEMVLLSACCSAAIQEQIGRLHPIYFSMLPCDIGLLADQIVFCCSEMSRVKARGQKTRQQLVSHALRECGLAVQSKGFCYARECILRLLCCKEEPLQLTKELYPAAAKACGTTPVNLERAIRSSIVSAWQREGFLLQKRLFYHRPTNGEFFSVIVQYVQEIEQQDP